MSLICSTPDCVREAVVSYVDADSETRFQCDRHNGLERLYMRRGDVIREQLNTLALQVTPLTVDEVEVADVGLLLMVIEDCK